MNDLPNEDQPDEIWIGPVGPIPVHYGDDPRLESERQAWKDVSATVDRLRTPDELLEAFNGQDWRVRVWVLDRLVALAKKDERLVPAMVEHLNADPAWQVRDRVATMLARFPSDKRIKSALREALGDSNSDVRESAIYALAQRGL
jgi:HEAT repeat protein